MSYEAEGVVADVGRQEGASEREGAGVVADVGKQESAFEELGEEGVEDVVEVEPWGVAVAVAGEWRGLWVRGRRSVCGSHGVLGSRSVSKCHGAQGNWMVLGMRVERIAPRRSPPMQVWRIQGGASSVSRLGTRGGEAWEAAAVAVEL